MKKKSKNQQEITHDYDADDNIYRGRENKTKNKKKIL